MMPGPHIITALTSLTNPTLYYLAYPAVCLSIPLLHSQCESKHFQLQPLTFPIASHTLHVVLPLMVHDTHLYDLLSVPATASLEEITKSYKRLALRYHPDKTNHDPELTEKFKDATRAYEILKDSSQRQVYDVFGEKGLDGSAPNSANTDFPGAFSCNQALTLFSQIFSDMSSVFGGGPNFNNSFPGFGFPQQGGERHVVPAPLDPNQNVPRRGTDIHHTFNVTMADMYYGKVVKFQLPRTTKCSVCHGVGCFNPRTCRVCNGGGRVIITMTNLFLSFQEIRSCSACRGSGTYYNKKDKCALCDEGYLTTKKIIKVKILPGSKDGDKCVLRGQADEGKNIIPGDLVIHLKEVAHKSLVRRFNDLYMEQDIDLRTALLGGMIMVPDFIRDGQNLQIFINSHGQSLLNDSIEPSISKGEVVGTINQGSVKIVKGLGMPINNHIKNGTYLQSNVDDENGQDHPSERGDLFIRFNVQIPTLSEFTKPEHMTLLSQILPQSAPLDTSASNISHHLSNLRSSKSELSAKTEPLIDVADLKAKAADAAADISSPDGYDYDQLEIDSHDEDDMEHEDKQYYESEWSNDAELLKRRKNNKDSPIPAKLKKPGIDPRKRVQT